MSRTDAHKPEKFKTANEKFKGNRYVKVFNNYGWPRCSKQLRRQLEHTNRQKTKRRLDADLDNYVDQKPTRLIYIII